MIDELKRTFYETIIVRGLIGPAMNYPAAELRGIYLSFRLVRNLS